jgi:hypothetical protein
MDKITKLLTNILEASNKRLKVKDNNNILRNADNEDDINHIASRINLKLGNEINLIREKINPLMEEYSNYLLVKIKDYKKDSLLSKYNIKELYLPSVYYELKDRGLIKEKQPFKFMENNKIIIPLPKENIRSYFKHPLGSINDLLQEVIVNYTDDELFNIWEKYLVLSNKTDYINKLNKVGYTLDLVALYVLTLNLMNTEDEVKNFTEYKNFVTSLHYLVANSMSIVMDEFKIYKKINKLVIGKQDDYTVTVIKDVYEKYLKENKLEAILGILVSNDEKYGGLSYLNEIIENTDMLLKIWDNKSKEIVLTEAKRSLNDHKIIYNISIKYLYEELLPDDLKEYVSNDIKDSYKILNDIFSDEPDDEILDPVYMSREIIGHILFPKTLFLKFTEYMLNYKKLHMQLNSQDTATLASVEVIMDYLLDGVECDNEDTNYG